MRFADAARPNQGHQAARGQLHQPSDFGQLVFAAQQGRQSGRQVVPPFFAREILGRDFLEQRSCLSGGFRAQFLCQHAAALFILHQCRTALPTQGQGAHELPVRLFTPLIEFQLARVPGCATFAPLANPERQYAGRFAVTTTLADKRDSSSGRFKLAVDRATTVLDLDSPLGSTLARVQLDARGAHLFAPVVQRPTLSEHIRRQPPYGLDKRRVC